MIFIITISKKVILYRTARKKVFSSVFGFEVTFDINPNGQINVYIQVIRLET